MVHILCYQPYHQRVHMLMKTVHPENDCAVDIDVDSDDGVLPRRRRNPQGNQPARWHPTVRHP